jgi:hypothetical protein
LERRYWWQEVEWNAEEMKPSSHSFINIGSYVHLLQEICLRFSWDPPDVMINWDEVSDKTETRNPFYCHNISLLQRSWVTIISSPVRSPTDPRRTVSDLPGIAWKQGKFQLNNNNYSVIVIKIMVKYGVEFTFNQIGPCTSLSSVELILDDLSLWCRMNSKTQLYVFVSIIFLSMRSGQ